MSSNMLKVLIVDDEHLIRTLLKRCIDWNSIGMKIVAEASSGEDAIDLVDKYKPDLIFTDICMASIDGIQFAEFIIKTYPHIKVVVISGFDDFEYAQRSIRAGIKDYLLKPIDDEVLLNTALKMKMEIEKERETISKHIILQKQFIENIPFLEERLFNTLIHHNINIDEVKTQMDYQNFRFKYDDFQLAVIEIILENEDNYTKKKKIYENRILDKLNGCLKQYENTYIFFDNNYRIIIINNGHENVFKNTFDNFKVKVLNDFNCYYSVGIGTIKNGIENIEKSYKEALEALNYRVILGWNSIINYDDINFSMGTQEDLIIEIDHKLQVYFLSGSKKMVQNIIDDIFEKKDISIIMSINKTREYAFSYITIIYDVLKELDIDVKELHSKKFDTYEYIFELVTVPDIVKYVTDISHKAIEIINYRKSKKSNKLIDEITKCMKLSIGDCELSLSKVAQIFFINPSYLSRMFKKEMKVNFMEYLTKLRIDKAIMLLNTTDLKSYEIGEKVGISDPSYFSTCFKRYTGVSVSEYKKVKQ